MSTKSNDIIERESVFVWIALATGVILLAPLIAMQFTNEVNWDKIDFIAMGALLFCTGSTFVLVSRKAPRQRRLAMAALFGAALFFEWLELAVGVFTNLGS
ncbi:MAG TPA: hypothetical protein VFF81_12665 [Noviherbaspirillum sp.]|nr:hypothetical protein [Noviherbaspirillum sp.]